MFNYLRSEFGSHGLMFRVSSSRQFIVAEIIPVVPAFPTVPAFRSFWISGRSGFLVVPDVLSFWLFSGRSGHWKQRRTLKRSSQDNLPHDARCKKNRIFFLLERTDILKEKTAFQNKKESRLPRSETLHSPCFWPPSAYCTLPAGYRHTTSNVQVFHMLNPFYSLQLVSSIDNSTTVDLGEPHLRPVYQTSWLLVILRSMEEAPRGRRITVTSSLS